MYLSKHNPKDMIHKNALITLLNEIDGNIDHELRHAIQFGLFGNNSEQTKTKKNYLSDIGQYYTSPVEFDPQIGSAIKEFVDYYKKNKTKNLKNAIRNYIGMSSLTSEPTDNKRLILKNHEPLRSSNFFHYLKLLAPKKYKIAVKKFISGIKQEIYSIDK